MNKELEAQTDPASKQRFLSWPRTRPGWWAVGLGLGVLFLPLLARLVSALLTVLSGGMQVAVGVFGLLVVVGGIAGGIIGLLAVARRHERSILVWAAILQGFFDLLFLGGEFIFPH